MVQELTQPSDQIEAKSTACSTFFDKFKAVDDDSRKNIFDLLTNGPVKTSRDWLKKLWEVDALAELLWGGIV